MALPVLRQNEQQRKIGSLPVRLRNIDRHILVLVAALLLAGCDPTKRIPEGSYLLKHHTVRTTTTSVDHEELLAIVKQKPNKRILGIPFYLGLYNLSDPKAVEDRRAVRDSACVERNLARAAKGRFQKRCDRSSRERNGEPPVILDTMLTTRSAEQIRIYMRKEGWFNATVRDTVHYRRRKLSARLFPKTYSTARGRPYKQAKAEIAYTVEPGVPYRFGSTRPEIDDPTIAGYIASTWEKSLIHPGDRYDTDVLDAERARITTELNDLGYLFFNKDLVVFLADTTVGDHQVDLRLRMERPYSHAPRSLIWTPEGTIYEVRNVTVQTDRMRATPWDSTMFQDNIVLHHGRLMYRPRPLFNSIFLIPNNRFNQRDAANTYSRLTALRVFDRVEITYDTTGIGKRGLADARIGLLPGKAQSMTMEVYGTNRGGFLGATFSLGYRHRNVLRTLGFFQGQMNFALETQQAFTRGASQANTGLGTNTFLNTVSIGPEVTVGFPLPSRQFSKSSGSRVTLNLLYNFQRRPDFTRTLARGSFGFDFHSTPTQHFDFRLPELSVIRIPSKSDEFTSFLQETNDPVFVNSYTDHLVLTFPKMTYTWNTQGQKGARAVKFLRSTFEYAGGLLDIGSRPTELDTITGRTYRTTFGIRYAEFVKIDNDFRINRPIHDRSSIAFRFAAGIGAPFSNLEVLPFEHAFFGGGANGLRAWQARSLGPGSYAAPLFSFDRVGEIRIEANFEYRFKLIGYLEGALFTDVGNIWNAHKDPARPGADFEVDDFVSELAVGTGVGARLNFDFFILRFDLGLQTKDPALPMGERWLFQSKDRYVAEQAALGNVVEYKTRLNLNLGIGYPF